MHTVFDEFPISYRCGRCGASPTVAPSREFKLRDSSVVVVVCGDCGGPTMITAGVLSSSTVKRPDGQSHRFRDVVEQIPSPSIDVYPQGVVPPAVARRYEDAQKAMNAGLWEQAIGTARTAVQVMCRLEDVKRGRLVDEIERLLEKKGAELPELVKSMAHRIRDGGNDVLHPSDLDWTPTSEEAEESLQLLRAVIEWLYAMPARLREAEEAVEGGRMTLTSTVEPLPPETLD